MKITNGQIDGIKIVHLDTHKDERGLFQELINVDVLGNLFPDGIRQISRSVSKKNVFRGLHFQTNPLMGKAIRVVQGSIVLYNVDLRKLSPTFLYTETLFLREGDNKIVFAPGLCARGFFATDDCEIEYFHNSTYNISTSYTIKWNDPKLAVRLPESPIYETSPIISNRDAEAMSVDEWLNEYESDLL